MSSGNLNITDAIDYYDKIIRGLDRPPIIIGHSFGGLFTQLLLDRGLGAVGVTLGTGARPKGVLRLPYSTLRAAWPALGNPRNLKKEAPLTLKQFHWCLHGRAQPGRVGRRLCHFPGQDGWEEVADFVLSWAVEHANRAAPSPA